MSLFKVGQSAFLYTIPSGKLLSSIYRLNKVIVSHKKCYRNNKNRKESKKKTQNLAEYFLNPFKTAQKLLLLLAWNNLDLSLFLTFFIILLNFLSLLIDSTIFFSFLIILPWFSPSYNRLKALKAVQKQNINIRRDRKPSIRVKILEKYI